MLTELRAAVRSVCRRPGVSAGAVLMLSLGVTVNVIASSLVRSVLFAPEPYHTPHELFQLLPVDHMAGSSLSVADLDALNAIPGVIGAAGCLSPGVVNSRTYPSLLVSTTEVSRGFFGVLGTRAHLGRTLQAQDFDSGVRHAVISFDLWQSVFGGAADVVGRRLTLNRQAFTVVGVMPADFAPPCYESRHIRRLAWIPLSTEGGEASSSGLSVMVRARFVEAEGPLQSAFPGVYIQQLGRDQQDAVRPGVVLMQVLAACLFLIACANLGSLLLLDAFRREAEMRTRACLGASPVGLIRQLLLESMVVSTAGVLIGGGLAWLAGSALRTLVAPVLGRGLSVDVALMDAAAGSVVGLLVASGVAAGAAVITVRRSHRSRATAGRTVKRLQQAMVASQVALLVVLASAAGVVGLSYVNVAGQELGLEPRGVMTSVAYLPPDSPIAFVRHTRTRLVAELNRESPATAMAFSDTPPFAGGSNVRVALDPAPSSGLSSVSTGLRGVTPNYFDVLRIRLHRGRAFGASSGDVGEAVASAAFARLLGGGDRVIGQVVRVLRTDRPYRIVGVAADVKTSWMWTPVTPVLYVALDETAGHRVSIAVRSDAGPTMAAALDRVIARVVPDAPQVLAEDLSSIMRRSEAERLFYIGCAVVLVLMAVVIAGGGLHTSVRRMVALRREELAIRVSLGADPWRVQRLVLRTALTPVMAGIVVGALVAGWLVTAVGAYRDASLVVNVIAQTAPDIPRTLLLVAVGTLGLTAATSWWPARRASTVDPAVLLKPR